MKVIWWRKWWYLVYGLQVHYRTRDKQLLFSPRPSLCLSFSVCLPVRLSIFINMANPSRILMKFCNGNFKKIWRGTPNLLTIRTHCWALYMKTHVYSYIVFYRMRKWRSRLSNVRWSWKTPISFVMLARLRVRPSVHVKQHGSHWTNFREIWNRGLSWKSVKITLSLVKIAQKHWTLDRKTSLFLILLVATYVAHLYGKCICVSMTKLSLFIIFFAVTYVKQLHIRKVILHFCGNNASANVQQHYLPHTVHIMFLFISMKQSLQSEHC